jgi:hypothetical protein
MFTITGEVRNVFKQENNDGTFKNKVQILGSFPTLAGGIREDLVTLSVPDGVDFEPLKKQVIRCPIGVFAPAKGVVTYFIPKGSNVDLVA